MAVTGRIPVMMLAKARCETNNSSVLFSTSSSEPAPFRLSLSKPSWIVKSESNVRREVRKKPNPPCVVCQGTGHVQCHGCCGKGLTS
uniref:Uncharacterized protein n=1 Tax=Kalanchoe fedtschenkoi TaxID=63787 RepID=A0A7N1A7M8_KALFE